jgi:hypothetical protein
MMRRLGRVTALIAVLGGTLLPATAASAAPSVQSQLAAVRNATAAYHDLDAAMADGFVPLLNCFDDPTAGGMGFHYFIPARMGVVNLTEPTALVYEPHDGKLQLVAVEYIVPDPDKVLPAPHLLGQEFGYLPGLHVWKLHAWIFRPNPAGMFADFNPNVRPCPAG